MPVTEGSTTYRAAGGVVVSQDGHEVLLLIRPQRDEIRLPKGHIEAGETPETAAIREVREETGYERLEFVADLGEQLVTFLLDDRPLPSGLIQRAERYFLLRALSRDQVKRPGPDERQFFVVWVGWDEALASLTFEAEKEWIRRAQLVVEQNL